MRFSVRRQHDHRPAVLVEPNRLVNHDHCLRFQVKPAQADQIRAVHLLLDLALHMLFLLQNGSHDRRASTAPPDDLQPPHGRERAQGHHEDIDGRYHLGANRGRDIADLTSVAPKRALDRRAHVDSGEPVTVFHVFYGEADVINALDGGR